MESHSEILLFSQLTQRSQAHSCSLAILEMDHVLQHQRSTITSRLLRMEKDPLALKPVVLPLALKRVVQTHSRTKISSWSSYSRSHQHNHSKLQDLKGMGSHRRLAENCTCTHIPSTYIHSLHTGFQSAKASFSYLISRVQDHGLLVA